MAKVSIPMQTLVKCKKAQQIQPSLEVQWGAKKYWIGRHGQGQNNEGQNHLPQSILETKKKYHTKHLLFTVYGINIF